MSKRCTKFENKRYFKYTLKPQLERELQRAAYTLWEYINFWPYV